MKPAGRLPPQDWMDAPETRRVIAALTATGQDARFVGGCVRDALAGRPVRDLDIATRATPTEVIELLEIAGIKTVPTGLAHGTVTAVTGGRAFEVTTLRVDIETDGRRARVAFTDDWQADAARRDFTINALSCAPDGTLYDPFGGIEDLTAGRIRFVGDPRARITEDYLRLLRLFRFQAHYGRTPPEPEILAITAELAPKLQQLSGERIRDELLRLLEAPDPLPVVETMIARGILAPVLPVASDARVLRRLLRAEPGPRAGPEDQPRDSILRLAAILQPGREPAEAVAERLRLSNRQRFALVQLEDPPVHPDSEPSAKLRHRAMRKLGLGLYLELLRLDWARHHAAESGRRPGERFVAAKLEAERHAAERFPLQGRDLLALGMPAGPRVGELLEAVEDWWAEQGFAPGRKECLAQARTLIEAGR